MHIYLSFTSLVNYWLKLQKCYLSYMIEGFLHISTICSEFNGSCIKFHPNLYHIRVSGSLPCIRICIVDIKLHMQMQMQGEWPCPYLIKTWSINSTIPLPCHKKSQQREDIKKTRIHVMAKVKYSWTTKAQVQPCECTSVVQRRSSLGEGCPRTCVHTTSFYNRSILVLRWLTYLDAAFHSRSIYKFFSD